MRAVTIPVSQKTGVGGFVFPGDHVDLVLTQTVRATDEGESLKAAETFLRNLRVLATDTSTETETVDGKTVVKGFRTVTLEVTPKIAEKIEVAQTIGTLSLSLRPLADSQSELEQAIASGSVKVPAGVTKEQEDKLLADAMNKPADGGTTFATGGDVSRFQRRSMPVASNREAMARQFAGGAVAQPVVSPAASGGTVVITGPVVRVTRGKVTTAEPVGKN
jgi:pilus assembly protein CpaB